MQNSCTVYHKGERVADISLAEIASWRSKPDIFIWVSVLQLELKTLSLLQKEFHLHELAIEDAVSNHQRPKIEYYGDIGFVVIQVLNMAKQKLRKRQLSIFVGNNFLISVGSIPCVDFLERFSRYGRGGRVIETDPGSMLYGFLDAVSDQYFPIIASYESQIDSMDSCIFNCDKSEENIKQLYAIKRGVLELSQAIYPLIEVTAKLHSGRASEVFDGLQDYFRDVHDHLVRMGHSTEVLKETIATAIQANLTAVTIEESKVTKKLAAWAAIFGVGTLMAGIWGMNFEFMPELRMKYGYPLAVIFILIFSGLIYTRFKRLGWA